MARIVMAANGSWGDVLPFIAVARRLTEQGHEVEFVLARSFHARVGAEGFTVNDAGWQIGADELTALQLDWARGGGVPMMRTVLRQLALPRLDDAHRALTAACDGADLLVCHVNQVLGPMVAAERGLPLATLSLFAMIVPTTEGLASSPLAELPPRLRRRIGRPLLAAVLAASGPLFYDRQFNAFRSSLGLPAERAYFVTAALAADRYLALFPPSFAPRPDDWPAQVELTGFCPWTGTASAVPAEVDEFIADGEPPVLVTMGTAGSTGISPALQRVAAELDRRGRRGLFLIGDDRHRTGTLADRRGVAAFAPLDLVVHRGNDSDVI